MDIALSALDGQMFQLSGVDFETLPAKDQWDRAANCMRFVLDGRIYVVTEDPDDGYRSAMGDLRIVDGPPVTNVFEPVAVLAHHVTRRPPPDDYYVQDMVQFTDVLSGHVVLEIGTENSDDYYPSFVANFWPEGLVLNQPPKPDPPPRSARTIVLPDDD